MDNIKELEQVAQQKLNQAIEAWYVVFCATPAGPKREWAADICEQLRCVIGTGRY
jgi:hypothetical protein